MICVKTKPSAVRRYGLCQIFLFANYHFGKSYQLIIKVISFFNFIHHFTFQLFILNRNFSNRFMFLNIKIGVEAFHSLKTLCLQSFAEFIKHKLNPFFNLVGIIGFLHLLFRTVTIVQNL